jgi:hypothetical protein
MKFADVLPPKAFRVVLEDDALLALLYPALLPTGTLLRQWAARGVLFHSVS